MSNQWVRTIALEGLLPAAGIAGTPLELFANGYTPESLGMLELGATTEKVRIPVIDGIGFIKEIVGRQGEEFFQRCLLWRSWAYAQLKGATVSLIPLRCCFLD